MRRGANMAGPLAAAKRKAGLYSEANETEQRLIEVLLRQKASGGELLIHRQWPGATAQWADLIILQPWEILLIKCLSANSRQGFHQHYAEVQRYLGSRLGLPAATISAITVRPSDSPLPAEADTLAVFAVSDLPQRLVLAAKLKPQKSLPVRQVSASLQQRWPEYGPPKSPSSPIDQGQSVDVDQPAVLWSEAEVREQGRAAARARPMEAWMSHLDPIQMPMVTRNWTGPARISGAAGTGKTVVGLHRAAWMAQHNIGTILFLTFDKCLPDVLRARFRDLAPHLADRVEFVNIHKFARNILAKNGEKISTDTEKIDNAFSLAWSRGKHWGMTLGDVVTNPSYWQDEIQRVIKGCGITTSEQYLTAVRVGRKKAIRRNHREQVWRLFQEYEELLQNKNTKDFDDLISMALTTTMTAKPDAYLAVIIDEVQDFSLMAIRLAHQVAGKNLLMLGDGRQTIYPGGFRLVEAGINVTGRSERLTVNYRNSATILQTATDVIAGQHCEDIDGSILTGRDCGETTYNDGQIVRCEVAADHDLDRALVAAIIDLQRNVTDNAAPMADAAILASKATLNHYMWLLREADIPYCTLEDYQGRATPAIKIGTVSRAKGLEFKSVFLPHYRRTLAAAEQMAEPPREAIEVEQRRLYVGMTRARDLLWLGSVTSDQSRPPHPKIDQVEN